jgi:hypothetical protein
MLSGDQKELIEQAAQADGLDMTTPAQPILLEDARKRVAKGSEISNKK